MSDPSVQEALDDVLRITDVAWQNDTLLTDDEMEAIASHIATLQAALSDEYVRVPRAVLVRYAGQHCIASKAMLREYGEIGPT